MNVKDLLEMLDASVDVEILEVDAAGGATLIRYDTAEEMLRDKYVTGREILEIFPAAYRQSGHVEVYVAEE